MLGKVEVFRIGVDGKQLIAEEDNMIVDGMKHHMADVFSLPPIPSSTNFTNTSSTVRDKRNFNAQAMTLGPAKDSFSMFNSSWYPSGVANLSADASSRFTELPIGPNIDFDAYAKNAIRRFVDNRYTIRIKDPELRTVGELDSPWFFSSEGAATAQVIDDGFEVICKNPQDTVSLFQDITPKQHRRYTIKTRSRGSMNTMRIVLLRISPTTEEINSYNFETGGWNVGSTHSFVEHGIGNRFSARKETTFRLPDFERDVLVGLSKYKYRLQIDLPYNNPGGIAGSTVLERVEILDEENEIVQNSRFDDRDSVLYNSNFSFTSPPPPTVVNTAEANALGMFAIDNWSRTSPLDTRPYPSQDLSSYGSIRTIASGDYFADVAPGNFVSLKASADGGVQPTDIGAAFLGQTAWLPETCFNPKWVDGDNLSWAGLPLISFWAYAPSASVLGTGLKIVLTEDGTGRSYNFVSDDTGRTMNSWDTEDNHWKVNPAQHEGWQFFSRFINLPKDAVGKEFTVSIYGLPNVNGGFGEYYIRSFTFGQIPGWKYGNQNASSTISLVHQHVDSSSLSGVEERFQPDNYENTNASAEYASCSLSSVAVNLSQQPVKSQTGIYSLFYNSIIEPTAGTGGVTTDEEINCLNQPIHGLDPDKAYFVRTISRPAAMPDGYVATFHTPELRFSREDFDNGSWEDWEFAGEPGLSAFNSWASPTRRDAPGEVINYKTAHPKDRCVYLGSSVGPNLLLNSNFGASSFWRCHVDWYGSRRAEELESFPGEAGGWSIDTTNNRAQHRPDHVRSDRAGMQQDLVQDGVWDDRESHYISYSLEDNTNEGGLWFNTKGAGGTPTNYYGGTSISSFENVIPPFKGNEKNRFSISCDADFNGKVSNLQLKEYKSPATFGAFRGLPGQTYTLSFEVYREEWNSGDLTDASIEIQHYAQWGAHEEEWRNFDFETNGWTNWNSNKDDVDDFRQKSIGATDAGDTGQWVTETVTVTLPPDDGESVHIPNAGPYAGTAQIHVRMNGAARVLNDQGTSWVIDDQTQTAKTYIRNFSLKGSRGFRLPDNSEKHYSLPHPEFTNDGSYRHQNYYFPPDATDRYGEPALKWHPRYDSYWRFSRYRDQQQKINKWSEAIVGPIAGMNEAAHHPNTLYNMSLMGGGSNHKPCLLDAYQLVDASMPLYDGDKEVLGSDYITSEKNYSGDAYDWTNGWHVSYADVTKTHRDVAVSSSPSGAVIEIRPNGGAYHFDSEAKVSLRTTQEGYWNPQSQMEKYGFGDTSAFTVETWIKPQLDVCATYSNHGNGIIYLYNNDGADSRSGWGLDMRQFAPNDGSDTRYHCIRFRVMNKVDQFPAPWVENSITSINTDGTFSAMDNEWSHIAAVVDGPNNKVELYCNGVSAAGSALHDYSGYHTNTLEIGRNTLNDIHFNGDISETRIYKAALASSVIAGHYNSGRGSYGEWDEEDLAVGWHLDTSSNGYHNNTGTDQPTDVSFSAYTPGHEPLFPYSRMGADPGQGGNTSQENRDIARHALCYLTSGFIDDVADPILYYVAKQEDLSIKTERDIAIGFNHLSEDMSRLELYVQVKAEDGRIWSWDPSSNSWANRQENYAIKVTATSGTLHRVYLTSNQTRISEQEYFRSPSIKVPRKFGKNSLWKIGISPKLKNQLPHQHSRCLVNNVRFYEVLPQDLNVPVLPEFPNPMDKSVQSKGDSTEPDREGHYLNFLSYSSILDMSQSELVRHGAYLPPSGMDHPSSFPFSGIYFASSTFGNPGSTLTSANDMSGYQYGEMTRRHMISPLGYIMKNPLPPDEQCVYDSSNGFVVSSTEYITSANPDGSCVYLSLGSDLLSGMGHFEDGLHPSSTTGNITGAFYSPTGKSGLLVSSGPFGRYGNSLCVSTNGNSTTYSGPVVFWPAAQYEKFLVTFWYKSIGGTTYADGAGDAALRFSFRDNSNADTTTAENFDITENGEWHHLSGILDCSGASTDKGRLTLYVHRVGTDVAGDKLIVDNFKIQKINFNDTSSTYNGEKEVKYVLTIPYKDYRFMKHYHGGIGTVGLWGLDYEKSSNKLGDASAVPYIRSTQYPSPVNNPKLLARAPGCWDAQRQMDFSKSYIGKFGKSSMTSGDTDFPGYGAGEAVPEHYRKYGYPFFLDSNRSTTQLWIKHNRDTSSFHRDFAVGGGTSIYDWQFGARYTRYIDFASSVIMSSTNNSNTTTHHCNAKLDFRKPTASATSHDDFLGVSAIMTRFCASGQGWRHTNLAYLAGQGGLSSTHDSGVSVSKDGFYLLMAKTYSKDTTTGAISGPHPSGGKLYVYLGGGANYAWREGGPMDDPADSNHVNLNDGAFHTVYVIKPAFNAAMPHPAGVLPAPNPFAPRVWIDGKERRLEQGGYATQFTHNYLSNGLSGLQGPVAMWDTTGLPLPHIETLTGQTGRSLNWSGLTDASGGSTMYPKYFWTMGNTMGPVSANGKQDHPNSPMIYDVMGNADLCMVTSAGATAPMSFSSYSYTTPYTGVPDNGGVAGESCTTIPVLRYSRCYSGRGGNLYYNWNSSRGPSESPVISPWLALAGGGAWDAPISWTPRYMNANQVSAEPGQGGKVQCSGLMIPDSWQHVVWVSDKHPRCPVTGREDFGTNRKIYINGKKITDDLIPEASPIDCYGPQGYNSVASSIGFYMCGPNRNNPSNGYDHQRACYKQFASWDKALTDDEVEKLYSNGYGLDPSSIEPSSLRLWYPLGACEGSGDFSAGTNNTSRTNAINKAGAVHADGSGYGTFIHYSIDNNLNTVEGREFLADVIRTDSPRHSQTPLYNFADLDEHPEYRLLAKKVFMPGGLEIPDNSDHNDYIQIEWTLKF